MASSLGECVTVRDMCVRKGGRLIECDDVISLRLHSFFFFFFLKIFAAACRLREVFQWVLLPLTST